MTAIVPVSAPRLRPVSDFRVDVGGVAPVRVRARLARSGATAAGGVLHVDVDDGLRERLQLRCAPSIATFDAYLQAHHPRAAAGTGICESEFYIAPQSVPLVKGADVELALVPDRFRRRKKGSAWFLYLRVCELSEIVDVATDVARRYDAAEAELCAAEAALRAAQRRHACALAAQRVAAEDYLLVHNGGAERSEILQLFIEQPDET
jgi:hypothetical protein